MPNKILSLDIHTNKKSCIDISVLMPLSEIHAIKQRSVGWMDTWVLGPTMLNVSVPVRLKIDHFYDERYRDIGLITLSERSGRGSKRRRYINLVVPLYTPYGAIDVRHELVILSTRKHFDLFVRPLSRTLMIRRRTKYIARFVHKHRASIVTSGVYICLLIVPIFWYVKVSIEEGYEKLFSLYHKQDLIHTQEAVHDARINFERAHFLFLPFSWIPLESVDLAYRASLGGLSLSRSLESLLSIVPTTSSGSTVLLEQQSDSIAPNYRADARDFYMLSRFGIDIPTKWMQAHDKQISTTIEGLSDAAKIYAGVHGESELAKKTRRVGVTLGKISTYLQAYLAHKDEILTMLGNEAPVRYVIFNQNRDEIRANGGFPGTVLSFTLYKGNILDYRQDDVYYYDWNLYPYKESPPPGLTLLSNNYGLRDVNYYPDFRETIEKANTFIERSGDSTITTGIAIHQGIIEEILQEIGSVQIPELSLTFDSQNFSSLMSTLVEVGYAREFHSKDILFSFIKAFLMKIDETRRYDVVFRVLEKYWNSGEILIASRDENTEQFLSTFKKPLPWECTISEQSINESISSEQTISSSGSSCLRNWIYPIFTSVGGNKTDRYIKRAYEASTKKKQGCTYENTITISNTHTFSKEDKNNIQNYMRILSLKDPEIIKKIDFVEGDSPNKSYVRIFVPPTAQLIGNGGSIDVQTGSLYTTFSFFLNTPVGSTATKSLHYTLQIPHCIDYSGAVNWYRQPGLREISIK